MSRSDRRSGPSPEAVEAAIRALFPPDVIANLPLVCDDTSLWADVPDFAGTEFMPASDE